MRRGNRVLVRQARQSLPPRGGKSKLLAGKIPPSLPLPACPHDVLFCSAWLCARSRRMVWFMLAVAVLNLALGYGAALALVEPPLWSGWRHDWLRKLVPPRPIPPQSPSREKPTLPAAPITGSSAVVAPAAGDLRNAASDLANAALAEPIVAGFDELPPDWLAQLAVEGIVAQSFVEATAHVLR